MSIQKNTLSVVLTTDLLKMQYKKETFGSIILNSKKQYTNFISEYIIQYASNN